MKEPDEPDELAGVGVGVGVCVVLEVVGVGVGVVVSSALVEDSLGGSAPTFTGTAAEVAAGAADEDSSSHSPSSSVAEGAAEVAEPEADRLAGLHLASRFLSTVSPLSRGWQQSSKN